MRELHSRVGAGNHCGESNLFFPTAANANVRMDDGLSNEWKNSHHLLKNPNATHRKEKVKTVYKNLKAQLAKRSIKSNFWAVEQKDRSL